MKNLKNLWLICVWGGGETKLHIESFAIHNNCRQGGEGDKNEDEESEFIISENATDTNIRAFLRR